MKLYDYPVTGSFRDHKKWTTPDLYGIDFGTNKDMIIPIKSGTVTFIGEDPNSINPRDGSKAKYIVIRENPNDERLYVHLSRITAVIGQFLDPDKGDIVGFGGDSGNTTGVHTHVTKRHDGVSVDFQDELDELKQIDMANKPVAGNEPPQQVFYTQKDLDSKLKPLQDKVNELNGNIVGLNTENENLASLRFKAEENLKTSEDARGKLESNLEALQKDFEAYKQSTPKGILETILNFILKK